MKLRYSYFIAKANNKGNPKSSILSILMLVLTVAFTLVSVFSAAITRGVAIYKNEVRARTLMIYPFHQLLYEDVLEQVKEVDHVEWIDMHDEMRIDGGAVSLDVVFRIVSRLLVTGTLILCLMNVVRSTTDMLVSRKSEIGLLKAVGYKNNAVFRCIALEQLLLIMRGFLAGAGISALRLY